MSPSYARSARHVTFALLAFLFGCAPQADALRREFGELKHDVAAVRAENAALRERIDALEEKGAPAPVPDSAPSSSAVSATDFTVLFGFLPSIKRIARRTATTINTVGMLIFANRSVIPGAGGVILVSGAL